MPMHRNKLAKAFKHEVQRSILLEEEDKKMWISKANTLHPDLLKMLVKLVTDSNRRVWKYIRIALTGNPAMLAKLRGKIKKITKETLALEEKAATPSAEKMLEEELGKI